MTIQIDPAKIVMAENVREAILSCSMCSLRAGCTAPVTWTGIAPSTSGIVCFGEAPGAKEDETGQAFQGASGRNLDACLEANYLDRLSVPVGNVVNCWPGEGNPDPTQEQISACAGWFHAQMITMEPIVAIGLGRFASASLCAAFTSHPFSGSRDYGKAIPATFSHGPGWVIPTWHPSPHNRARSKNYRLVRDAITVAATKVWEHRNGSSAAVGIDLPWGSWWESERTVAVGNLNAGCPIETIRAHWSAGIAKTRSHPYLIRAMGELAMASVENNPAATAARLEIRHVGY